MRRSHSLHPNQLPPLLTKFVQLVFDRLSIELAGQKFSLNSKRNDLVFPFIHIALKKLFLPNASGSYWPTATAFYFRLGQCLSWNIYAAFSRRE